MLAIKNNLMAANAARHLGKSYNALARSVERLSSGLRINSAKDDAAGLAVRELIRADVAQFKQAARNAADGISMIQTGEGAMGEIDSILIRMKELAEQASTGSYSSAQRVIMNAEYAELAAEITRIAGSTAFNENELLNSTTEINIHVGSGNITITPEVIDAATLGVSTTLATKETWVNLRTVASADQEYLSSGEITNGAKEEFQFKFGTGGTAYTITLGAYEGTGMSLNQLVDAINTQVDVQNAGDPAYAAATALYSSAYQSYTLQMQAVSGGVLNIVITDGANCVDILDATTDFTESQDGVAGSGNSLVKAASAAAALDSITTAINTKDTYRAKLGYWMNRLEAAESVLGIQAENLLVAESRISDVDVATEMAEMTRTQVLAQAGIAMLAQANAMPQMALTLLR